MRGPKGGLGRQRVIGRNDQSAGGAGAFEEAAAGWVGAGDEPGALAGAGGYLGCLSYACLLNPPIGCLPLVAAPGWGAGSTNPTSSP